MLHIFASFQNPDSPRTQTSVGHLLPHFIIHEPSSPSRAAKATYRNGEVAIYDASGEEGIFQGKKMINFGYIDRE